MPDNDESLGDQQTYEGGAQPADSSERSLGDRSTFGGGADSSLSDIGGLTGDADLDMEIVDLSRYEIQETLGKGGMGEVLLATDTRLNRKVAIKRMLGDATRNQTAVRRFLTEAQSIAALNHFNIVQIYDYGRDKDGPFLIMEYVDGGSLLDKCREGALPLEGYLHPVYITPDSTARLGFALTEDKDASQLLSQYECATLPLYSAQRQAMFTTFFGGISQFYWDPETQSLKRDKIDFSARPPVDGLPFINSISTLRVETKNSSNYLHAGEKFPPEGNEPHCAGDAAPYLGSNSIFVPAADLPTEHGVIQLDGIRQTTTVGYIVGGIAAVKPYPGPATCASDVIYRVYLDPAKATTSVKLALPTPVEE